MHRLLILALIATARTTIAPSKHLRGIPMLNRASPILLLLMMLLGQGSVNAQTQLPDAGSQNVQSKEQEPAIVRPSQPAAAGSRVYRDPVTGEFTGPPPEAAAPIAPAKTREAVSTEPLPTMQETAIEGGGTRLHLQGRFRSYMSATKDAAGNVTVHCDDEPRTK